MRVAVIAGEPIYANVRLRLTANRTYGLDETGMTGIRAETAHGYQLAE